MLCCFLFSSYLTTTTINPSANASVPAFSYGKHVKRLKSSFLHFSANFPLRSRIKRKHCQLPPKSPSRNSAFLSNIRLRNQLLTANCWKRPSIKIWEKSGRNLSLSKKSFHEEKSDLSLTITNSEGSSKSSICKYFLQKKWSMIRVINWTTGRSKMWWGRKRKIGFCCPLNHWEYTPTQYAHLGTSQIDVSNSAIIPKPATNSAFYIYKDHWYHSEGHCGVFLDTTEIPTTTAPGLSVHISQKHDLLLIIASWSILQVQQDKIRRSMHWDY